MQFFAESGSIGCLLQESDALTLTLTPSDRQSKEWKRSILTSAKVPKINWATAKTDVKFTDQIRISPNLYKMYKMFAYYSSQIKIAIFQSVSKRQGDK